MVRQKYILGIILLSLFLTLSLVSASGDVLYIYKSKVNSNIIDIFSNINMTVDLVKDTSVPSDLSMYKLIFIGDENFALPISIEKYPSIIFNSYIGPDIGITNNVGISKLFSSNPLAVNLDGKIIQVYTSAKDNMGISIPYYYLDNQNRAPSLLRVVGTFSTSSGDNFGDVISYGPKKALLLNGKILEQPICFFGITKTQYWTLETRKLFLDCIKYVYDYTYVAPLPVTCSKDLDCGVNKFIGTSSCSNNSVFQAYLSFKCVNPGNSSSYCTNTTTTNLVQSCSGLCSDGSCQTVVCKSNLECNDNNPNTEDFCKNPGTIQSSCNHVPITCLNNNQCNDNDPSTEDICLSTGTTNSSCAHNLIKCSTNSECNDNNPSTEDICLNPGKGSSSCIYQSTITDIKLVLMTATASTSSVTLSFQVQGNSSLVQNFQLKKEDEDWITLSKETTTYTFNGLNPSTSYVFIAKASDIYNKSTPEMNVTVKTNDLPPSPPSNGGGGSSGGGGGGGSSTKIVTTTNSLPKGYLGSATFCKVDWQCSSWGECIDSKQTRTCSYPENMCKPEVDKPIETQSCVETTVPTVVSQTTQEAPRKQFNDSPSTNPDNNKPASGNLITGAAIAQAAGKYSWLIFLIAAGVVGSLYYFFVAKGASKTATTGLKALKR